MQMNSLTAKCLIYIKSGDVVAKENRGTIALGKIINKIVTFTESVSRPISCDVICLYLQSDVSSIFWHNA